MINFSINTIRNKQTRTVPFYQAMAIGKGTAKDKKRKGRERKTEDHSSEVYGHVAFPQQ